MAFDDRKDQRPRHGINTDQWRDEVQTWAEDRNALRRRTKELDKVGLSHIAHPASYFWNLLISIDQLGNAFLAGDPDETISSRIGKAKLRGDLHLVGRIVDAVLEVLDENHSIDAIEPDEGLPDPRVFVNPEHAVKITALPERPLVPPSDPRNVEARLYRGDIAGDAERGED